MSMMFQEMQNCYKNSIFLTQNTQKLINFLALDVKSKMCSNCINRLQCNEKKDIIQWNRYPLLFGVGHMKVEVKTAKCW